MSGAKKYAIIAILLLCAGVVIPFLLLMAVFAGSSFSMCSEEALGGGRGDAPANATLFAAIDHVSKGDNKLMAAMLLASYLESRWNPRAISNDGAFGAYQIQSPGVVNTGITIDEALDPAYATNYMVPRFRNVLQQQSTDSWSTNPERAAHDIAYRAERPRLTYYESQGTELVRTGFTETLKVMQSMGRDTSSWRSISSGSATVDEMCQSTDESGNSLIPLQGDWRYPLDRVALGSSCGSRFHPILHIWRLHAGQDISATSGTPIYAVQSGKVVSAGYFGGAGNHVVVQHADAQGRKVESTYSHMSRISAFAGRSVEKGDTIGYVGSTGLSTGPHLHFEIRIDGVPVEPMRWLQTSGSTASPCSSLTSHRG